MKYIAITQRLIENTSYYEIRESLDIAWGKFFKEINIIPITLPINYDFEIYFKNINIEGILLTGGNDIDINQTNTLSQKRDSFEKKLISYGIYHNIPILGVCRGMQMIATYFDARLKKIEGHINIKHTLKINKKSKYFQELDHLKTVNAFHNYTIDSINNDFIISARDEKNHIKAIEHKYLKIFGQMWHSEREKPFNSHELNLIYKFFHD